MYFSRKPIRSWAGGAGLVLFLAALCLWSAGCGQPGQVQQPTQPSPTGQPGPSGEQTTSAPAKYPEPDVSGLSFKNFAFKAPANKYRSGWTLRTSQYNLSLDSGALQCSFAASGDVSQSVYGGVLAPVARPKALKLDVSFQNPENIVVFYVDGYTRAPKGKPAVRWEWRNMTGREIPAGRATYVLAPGKGSGYWRSTAGNGSDDVVKLDIFARIKPGTSTAFTVHNLEFAN